MKKLVILALLALTFCGHPAYAQDVPSETPPACGFFLQTMQGIDKALHIEKLINLPRDKREALRDWVNAQEPVSEDKFDLVLVVDHGDGKYGVVMGWLKDLNARGQATICVGELINEANMTKFLEITGLPGGSRGSI